MKEKGHITDNLPIQICPCCKEQRRGMVRFNDMFTDQWFCYGCGARWNLENEKPVNISPHFTRIEVA